MRGGGWGAWMGKRQRSKGKTEDMDTRIDALVVGLLGLFDDVEAGRNEGH